MSFITNNVYVVYLALKKKIISWWQTLKVVDIRFKLIHIDNNVKIQNDR